MVESVKGAAQRGLAMSEYDSLLKELENEEAELQFTSFGNETALDLGLLAIEIAKAGGLAVTINIERDGHQLFHYSFAGTSPDNDQWVIRKNRVVHRFHRSSLYIGTKLKKIGKTLEEKYLISSNEYAPHGGAFPIIIRGTGVIGTITVSGLTQEEDHMLVVQTLRKYIASRK